MRLYAFGHARRPLRLRLCLSKTIPNDKYVTTSISVVNCRFVLRTKFSKKLKSLLQTKKQIYNPLSFLQRARTALNSFFKRKRHKLKRRTLLLERPRKNGYFCLDLEDAMSSLMLKNAQLKGRLSCKPRTVYL